MNTPLLASLNTGGLELLVLALLVGFCVFWIWMIVDCVTAETDQNQKVAWIIALALVGVIAAPLYLIVRKLPRGKRTTT